MSGWNCVVYITHSIVEMSLYTLVSSHQTSACWLLGLTVNEFMELVGFQTLYYVYIPVFHLHI